MDVFINDIMEIAMKKKLVKLIDTDGNGHYLRFSTISGVYVSGKYLYVRAKGIPTAIKVTAASSEGKNLLTRVINEAEGLGEG